jgi:hypothetical protein
MKGMVIAVRHDRAFCKPHENIRKCLISKENFRL